MVEIEIHGFHVM